MVCDRCIKSVKLIFNSLDIRTHGITLGEVGYDGIINDEKMQLLKDDLEKEGFEMIDATTPVLVTKIKSALIQIFGENEVSEDFKLSTFLTKRFPYDYSHLSRVFSHHEGDTIERYLIRLRIEKAKELLTYKDINVSEVAYRLGYASAAHFSRQFKKIVGMSPSIYRDEPNERKSLEDI